MNLVAKLRRVTTSGNYLPEIDGLRFIAIMAVVALHADGYWRERAGRTYDVMSAADIALRDQVGLGYYGVHLFFMISGFVLALPFCKQAICGGKAVDLSSYFWRRLTRLEPPYVVSMLGFFALMPFFGKGSWRELLPHLLASLGYVHELVYGEGSPINNNAWSLEIEIQFYLLMPVLAGLLWLPPLPRRVMLSAAAIALSMHSLWLPAGAPRTILQFGQYFLLGILACDLWTTTWRHRQRSWFCDIPGLVAWPLFSWVNLRHPGVWADLATPWVIGMLFFSALRGLGHSRVLSYSFVPVIGGMCYSIYLLHARATAAVVHGCLAKFPLFGSFIPDYSVVLLASIAASLAISAVFFLLIEKPCMNPDWPRDLLSWAGIRCGRGQAIRGQLQHERNS